jgi:type I restriction enzyme S subunit
MNPVPHIDIRPEHWAIVASILQRHLPHTALWAFGSRARFAANSTHIAFGFGSAGA